MLTIVCITILAYCIMGKNIRALLERIKGVDWSTKSRELFDKLRPYVLKVGRMAARPLLQFYYVMTDESTPVVDKALVYAAIIYIISPASLIPSAMYKLLGVLDESAAMLYVYKKIEDESTPVVDKALVYAAIIYIISPASLIPSAMYKLLGVLDESAAMLYVYKKIEGRITPGINAKVEDTLNEWFGAEYEMVQ